MSFTLCVHLSLLLSSASPENAEVTAVASRVATELTAGLPAAPKARVLLAPLQLVPDDPLGHAFESALAAALAATNRVHLVDRRSLEASLGEAALQQANGSGWGEIGGALGAQWVILGSLNRVGDSYLGSVRLAGIEGAQVIKSAEVRFAASGQTLSLEATTLDAQMRRLSDLVASRLSALPGEVRYQRFAVLTFEESGELTRKRQLGLLVAAELTTRLQRDHALMVVERAQLTRIVDELALGQSGMVEGSQASEVGRLAGAQALVLGSVAEAGDRFLVNARIVDGASGSVVAAEQVALPAADLVALSADAVVLRSLSGSVYRSMLLPGWAQFYNRAPVKGAMFVGGELVAGAAALVFHLLGTRSEQQYRDLPVGTAAAEFDVTAQQADRNYARRNWALVGLLAIRLVGVADAIMGGWGAKDATPDGALR